MSRTSNQSDLSHDHILKILQKKIKAHNHDAITINEVIHYLKGGGFAVFLILFSAPTALPLPALPGVTLLFAIPIFIVSLQMVLGFPSPKLPSWLGLQSIKRQKLAKIILVLITYFRKIRWIFRARLQWVASKQMEKIVGVFCICLSIFVSLPIPLTNSIPSLGILVIGFGLLEKDGVIVILGSLIGILGMIFAVGIYFLGVEALSYLF